MYVIGHSFKLVLATTLVLLALATHAEIYKWVDENGRTHYSDQKPPNSVETQEIKREINTYESVSYESLPSSDQPISKPAKRVAGKVIMYSAEWCGFCKKARRYFMSNKIPFVEYDIDKDKKAREEYQRLGARGVPVILYKNRRMNGFSEAGFEAFYNNGSN